jgi:hypothetical protein
MAGVNIGNVVTAAIATAAAQAASSPNNDMQASDVNKVVSIAEDAARPIVREMQSRVDYITNNESLPKSWSFNAAVVAVLSSALTIYGALSDGLQMDKDQIILIGAGGTLISAAGWLIGRIRGKPIGE